MIPFLETTLELSREYASFFAALGTLTIPDDRPFERRWTFVRSEEVALGVLRSLGVKLAPTPREDPR